MIDLSKTRKLQNSLTSYRPSPLLDANKRTWHYFNMDIVRHIFSFFSLSVNYLGLLATLAHMFLLLKSLSSKWECSWLVCQLARWTLMKVIINRDQKRYRYYRCLHLRELDTRTHGKRVLPPHCVIQRSVRTWINITT